MIIVQTCGLCNILGFETVQFNMFDILLLSEGQLNAIPDCIVIFYLFIFFSMDISTDLLPFDYF